MNKQLNASTSSRLFIIPRHKVPRIKEEKREKVALCYMQRFLEVHSDTDSQGTGRRTRRCYHLTYTDYNQVYLEGATFEQLKTLRGVK